MTGVVLLAAAVVAAGVIIVLRRRAAAEPVERPWASTPGERNRLFWGYRDTGFEFCGRRTVRLSGNRYPLAGHPLPEFNPFAASVLGVSLRPEDLRDPVPPPTVPAPRDNEAFTRALAAALPDVALGRDDADRLAHSHGQLSVDEVYRIASGEAPARVVDAVVRPGSADAVATLVRLAAEHDVVLIPYGGGTNVSGALLCPPQEQRMIVSVDLAHMDRVLEIDGANGLASVEAGITGRALEEALEAAGYTAGHVPDSIEFSTLGGWIATHASGMKKNRYGNIEEVVRGAELVTPEGVMCSRPVVPRTSAGIEPRRLLFGHEGGLGIITRADIQIHPLPQERRYASFVFPDFGTGLGYLRAVQQAGIAPASIRLANNTEFRLGRALAPERGRLHRLIARAKAAYVLRLRGFSGTRMVACTLVMEGNRREVRDQWRALARLGRAHGGLSGGADGGRRGYQATFAIAYIRDFLNRFGILGETFETTAPWSRVEAITGAVAAELDAQCTAHGVTGRPYLSWRVSQSYTSGVCIYFTMGFSGRGLADPAAVYQRIEHRLRAVILEQGGSLSHHHGVGKVRRDFMPQVHSPVALEAMRALKAGVDPGDVFAAGNHAFGLAAADADDRSAAGDAGA